MNKQINVFLSALEKIKSTITNGNNGADFENQIKHILNNSHFVETSFKKDSPIPFFDFVKEELSYKEFNKILNELKNKVIDKKNVEVIRNPFNNYLNNKNLFTYIYQPFGSQQFPDFLILLNDFVFPLETKFSTKRNKKQLPKWNSNIPKTNAIYVFGSILKVEPIIFLGNDYISNDVKNLFINHFEEFDEKKLLKQLKIKLENEIDADKRYNPFSLYPKIRTDFIVNKDFKFGNDMNLDIYDFSEKMKWWDNVRNFLLGLYNEE